ncbi:MAG: hypothetical protein ABI134_34415, partial [Byssovorax sp.]
MRHLPRFSLPPTLRVAGLGALLLSASCSSQEPTKDDLIDIDVERYDLKGRFDWDRSVLSATLDYEATPGTTLIAMPAREGDPLAVRALYTASEPQGARRWMPCNDRPSDRAVFSADLWVDASEKLISNGDLVSDSPEGAGHRVKNETAYTLPTYLMAFAVADFEVETVKKGDLPVSVWHRRGLAARARHAVDAQALPTMRVTSSSSGGATVTLHDPEGTLLAPMDLLWISADGATRTQTLEADVPLDLTPQADEYLVLDPSDRHPDWSVFFEPGDTGSDYELRVLQRLAPENPDQVASFLDIGGANQLAGLQQGLPPVAPEEFASFVAGLDGEPARMMAIKAACSVAVMDGVDPAVRAAWAGVITTSLETSSSSWGLDFVGQTRGYADCDALVMPELLFRSDYEKLRTDTNLSGNGDARLALLAQFTISPELALSTWENVARTSNSLRARKLAVRYLRRYVSAEGGLDPALLPAFRALFLDVLQHSEVAMVLGQDI